MTSVKFWSNRYSWVKRCMWCNSIFIHLQWRPACKHPTLLDMVNISDTVIANCLIDQVRANGLKNLLRFKYILTIVDIFSYSDCSVWWVNCHIFYSCFYWLIWYKCRRACVILWWVVIQHHCHHVRTCSLSRHLIIEISHFTRSCMHVPSFGLRKARSHWCSFFKWQPVFFLFSLCLYLLCLYG